MWVFLLLAAFAAFPLLYLLNRKKVNSGTTDVHKKFVTIGGR